MRARRRRVQRVFDDTRLLWEGWRRESVCVDTGLGWRMGGGRKIGHNQSSRLVAILSSRAIFCVTLFSSFHDFVFLLSTVRCICVKVYVTSL